MNKIYTKFIYKMTNRLIIVTKNIFSLIKKNRKQTLIRVFKKIQIILKHNLKLILTCKKIAMMSEYLFVHHGSVILQIF